MAPSCTETQLLDDPICGSYPILTLFVSCRFRICTMHLHFLYPFIALCTTLLPLYGCIPSTITQACTDIAEKQCSQCFESCTINTQVGGTELCKLSKTSTTKAKCIEDIIYQCEEQESVREDPHKDLDACLNAIESQTCSDLYKRHALNGAPPTAECARIL